MQINIRLHTGTPVKVVEKVLKEQKDLHPHGRATSSISQGTEVERVIGRGRTFLEEASGGGGGSEVSGKAITFEM